MQLLVLSVRPVYTIVIIQKHPKTEGSIMKLTFLLRRFLLAAIVPLCLTAWAAAETRTLPVYVSATLSEPVLQTEAVSLQSQSLEDRLYQGLLQHEAVIDVSDFNLHISESGKITDAVLYLIQNRTDLDHFNGGFQIVYDPHTELIIDVRPGYFGAEAPPEEEDRTEELLNEILAMIDTGWSDFEKVLFINDYLASNFEYDLTYSIYDIENFLTYGTGVCEAYYLTTRALLDALGIPSCAAISDNADHIWNVVQLNGKWYHLDVTWNDPVYDALGLSRHYYFLVSTQQLHRQDQSGYSSSRTDFYLDATGVSCTDTTYDGYYWTEVETPFVRLNGQWYYSNSEAICRTSNPLAEGTPVIRHGVWPDLDNPYGYWLGAFTGLGSCGDWLIYNTANEVMAYRPTDGAKEILYKNTDNTLDIYGLRVNGTTAICALSTSPNDYMVDTATVSLVHLSYPNERQTLFRGLKIYEGSGCITVTGKPNDAEPFYLMAASYSDQGKLLDIRMISSQQITGTTFQWMMKSGNTQIFLTNPSMTPAK